MVEIRRRIGDAAERIEWHLYRIGYEEPTTVGTATVIELQPCRDDNSQMAVIRYPGSIPDNLGSFFKVPKYYIKPDQVVEIVIMLEEENLAYANPLFIREHHFRVALRPYGSAVHGAPIDHTDKTMVNMLKDNYLTSRLAPDFYKRFVEN